MSNTQSIISFGSGAQAEWQVISQETVSYTHLDVYKRQDLNLHYTKGEQHADHLAWPFRLSSRT